MMACYLGMDVREHAPLPRFAELEHQYRVGNVLKIVPIFCLEKKRVRQGYVLGRQCGLET